MLFPDEIQQLYQEVILDHNRLPRNYGKLPHFTHIAEGYNPLCGDQLTLYLLISPDEVIEQVGFEAKGCAISRASASLMSEEIKGRTVEQAHTLFRMFHDALTGNQSNAPTTDQLGKLVVLLGVRQFPARVKCATLAWHTLEQALQGSGTVSTE